MTATFSRSRVPARRHGAASGVVAALVLSAGLGPPAAGFAWAEAVALNRAAIQLAQAQPEPAPAAPGQEDPRLDTERFKDWSVQCAPQDSPDAGKCYAVHTVFTQAEREPIVQFVIGRFGTDKVLGALIFVPLGVRLPPGISVRVDDKEPQRFALERCTTKGCQAQVKVDDSLLQSFKAGIGGEVIFHDSGGRAVAVDFSLKGFSAALAKVPG